MLVRTLLVLLAAALLFALHVAPLPDDTALWRSFTNAMHAPAFGLVAVGILELGRRRGAPSLASYPAAFAVTAAVAAAAEISQVVGPRAPTLSDWLRDLVGAAAGLLIHATFALRFRGAGRTLRAAAWAVRIAALAALLLGFVPVARWAHATLRRDAAFPVLGSFESAWETTLWRAQGGSLELAPPPPAWPRPHGARVARLRLEPGRYPGVRLDDPPHRWERYEALELALYSPHDEPVTLVLRIHDERHGNAYEDRFNKKIEVGRGAHELRVPLDDVRRGPRARELDLSRIAGLVLYVPRTSVPLTLYLDDVRLVTPGDGG